MDNFYFNVLFIYNKFANIIVLLLEIFALFIYVWIMGIIGISSENDFLVYCSTLILMMILLYANSYLSSLNKNRGEYIEFKNEK